MRRLQHHAGRLSIVGALALVIGSSLVAGVLTQSLTRAAFADTPAFEVFCPGTPLGNLVLNDVTATGTLSPADPAAGQQFNLTGVQIEAQLPASVVQQAEAVGLTSLSGTVSTTVDAVGATPSHLPTGAVAFDVPIPNPVPSSGVALDIPSPAVTVGPFTATGGTVTLSADAGATDITFNDGEAIGVIDLHCSFYPDDMIPAGFTDSSPPGLPVSPVIATTGQPTPPPTTPSLTGAYELYCPHTPVGDLVLNDVVTSATVSPASLAAGDQFNVTGYQTHIPLPAGLVSAAAGLGNSSFDGLAASAVDGYGATPTQVSTGSMSFDVPIPSPVPSSGLGVDFPTSPASLGPFIATGGRVTIAQDQSTHVVAALSSKAFTMSCTAYPNDSVPVSGSTGTAPTGPPIRPVIAVASASGSTPPPPPTTIPPTAEPGPYELYCPGSPVGDLVLNDTSTTATITPSTLAQGQQFGLSDFQTQFSIPQSVVEQAEALGLTQISGDAAMFLDTTGVSESFDGSGPVRVGAPGGSSGPITTIPNDPITTFPPPNPGGPPIPEPFPEPFPGVFDMPFSVTLPNPVPSTGVQFEASASPDELGSFTALGGPITFAVNEVDLDVTEFGDSFGLFCTPYPNDTEPTGLTTAAPSVPPVEPVVATGSATITPPPPIGPGGVGPYELYCPGSPIGAIAFNDVTTSAALSPAEPSAGQQFSVTNYQAQVPIPASIASAAAAVGNTSLSGTATITIDAAGATPASIPTGPLSFDVALPPSPTSGVTLTAPSTPATVGPFTATSDSITIAQNADVSLTLLDAGTDINLSCTAYPNDSDVTGITVAPPDASAISPVIVTSGPAPTVPPSEAAGPYELYCPGTPVGNIVINDVTTSATIPDGLATDQSFDASGFQTQFSLPQSIAAAAAALGNSAITGTAVLEVDAQGAAPATVSSGPIDINVPIPSPVPSTGLAFALPSPPGTIGPLLATGGAITLSVDPAVQLTLVVSGSDLNLTCHPYPNHSAPTGIVPGAPDASPVSPVIATGSTQSSTPPTSGTTPTFDSTTQAPTTTVGAGGATTATTTDPPSGQGSSTTAPGTTGTQAGASHPSTGAPTSGADPVVRANSSSLAFTGLGDVAQWVAIVGGALIVLGFTLLVMTDTPRRIRYRMARRARV